MSIFRPKLDGHSRFTTLNDLILIVAYTFENADRDNETKSEVCPSNYGTIKYVTSLKFDVAILVTFAISMHRRSRLASPTSAYCIKLVQAKTFSENQTNSRHNFAGQNAHTELAKVQSRNALIIQFH